MHCYAEVTESSTNKQPHLSLSPPHANSFVIGPAGIKHTLLSPKSKERERGRERALSGTTFHWHNGGSRAAPAARTPQSPHRFPDERTPIEATPLSATSVELGLCLGLGLGLDSLSHLSSHAPSFFSSPSFHTLSLSPAFTSVWWSSCLVHTSLGVSHRTCPPLSSSPHAHSFVLVIGPAVIRNKHTRFDSQTRGTTIQETQKTATLPCKSMDPEVTRRQTIDRLAELDLRTEEQCEIPTYTDATPTDSTLALVPNKLSHIATTNSVTLSLDLHGSL